MEDNYHYRPAELNKSAADIIDFFDVARDKKDWGNDLGCLIVNTRMSKPATRAHLSEHPDVHSGKRDQTMAV